MSFCLRILEGKNQGEEYPLTDGENLIGRSRSSHIRVYNEDVSGKHFILEIRPQGAVLHNISAYGTQIDGEEVLKDADIHPGQVISAGKTLKLLFAEFHDGEEPQDANEATCVTKFVSDVSAVKDECPEDEATSVTRFVQDTANGAEEKEAGDDSEMTSVTKFAGAETAIVFSKDSVPGEEATQATQFINALSSAAKAGGQNDLEKTQAVPVEEPERLDSEKTQAIPVNDSDTRSDWENVPTVSADDLGKSSLEKTQAIPVGDAAGKDDAEKTQTIPVGDAGMSPNENLEEKPSGNAKESSDTPNSFFTGTAAQNDSSDTPSPVMEEQGMFFEEEEYEESEKTSANETQVVQTRMASMDEMNFIKNQIKKQQQSRLFFKFLIFSLLIVFLGIIWMMKAPQNEKVLSWPHTAKGDAVEYHTASMAAWDGGYKKGAFDLYYPAWKKNHAESVENKIMIHSFLGKNGDVPLEIIFYREDALSHVYESRENALKSALKRLSENPDEMFNIDSNSVKTFLIPEQGPAGNGILCDVVTYQKDKERSWFGVLRFFRHGRYNYILRAEVPASEKHRAMSILVSDTFLTIHPQFVKSHWEGNDEYVRGDVDRMILGIRDELLNHNSPMQYPRLELAIKSILAQSRYNNQRKPYLEGMELLLLLREKQQLFYNKQKIRWISAVRENNRVEKIKIRNESEAVFSISSDKRRFDILRDYWE